MIWTGNLGFAHPPKSLVEDDFRIFNLEDIMSDPETSKFERAVTKHQSNVKKILDDIEK
jgi:hypothetical protein